VCLAVIDVNASQQTPDSIETDYARVQVFENDLGAVVGTHDIVLAGTQSTRIEGEFTNGWLDSERCRIVVTVQVSMDAPGWRVAAFEDRVESMATITDRTVRGSTTAPDCRAQNDEAQARPVQPPEARRAHTGYYTITRDVTGRLPSIRSTTILE